MGFHFRFSGCVLEKQRDAMPSRPRSRSPRPSSKSSLGETAPKSSPYAPVNVTLPTVSGATLTPMQPTTQSHAYAPQKSFFKPASIPAPQRAPSISVREGELVEDAYARHNLYGPPVDITFSKTSTTNIDADIIEEADRTDLPPTQESTPQPEDMPVDVPEPPPREPGVPPPPAKKAREGQEKKTSKTRSAKKPPERTFPTSASTMQTEENPWSESTSTTQPPPPPPQAPPPPPPQAPTPPAREPTPPVKSKPPRRTLSPATTPPPTSKPSGPFESGPTPMDTRPNPWTDTTPIQPYTVTENIANATSFANQPNMPHPSQGASATSPIQSNEEFFQGLFDKSQQNMAQDWIGETTGASSLNEQEEVQRRAMGISVDEYKMRRDIDIQYEREIAKIRKEEADNASERSRREKDAQAERERLLIALNAKIAREAKDKEQVHATETLYAKGADLGGRKSEAKHTAKLKSQAQSQTYAENTASAEQQHRHSTSQSAQQHGQKVEILGLTQGHDMAMLKETGSQTLASQTLRQGHEKGQTILTGGDVSGQIELGQARTEDQVVLNNIQAANKRTDNKLMGTDLEGRKTIMKAETMQRFTEAQIRDYFNSQDGKRALNFMKADNLWKFGIAAVPGVIGLGVGALALLENDNNKK